MDTGCLEVRLPEAELLQVLTECEGHIKGPYRGPGNFFCHTFEILGGLRGVSTSLWEDDLTALYSHEDEITEFLPNLKKELEAKGIEIVGSYFGDMELT